MKFGGYIQFALVFLACIFAASIVLALSILAFDMYKDLRVPITLTQFSLSDEEKTYALKTIGHDSVYQFMLGKSIRGWIVVFATLAA